jgi:hypothetical protein
VNRDEIIRMAQEADPGFGTGSHLLAESLVGMEVIEQFAALVAAHERKRCATLCDEVGEALADEMKKHGEDDSKGRTARAAAHTCAYAIRSGDALASELEQPAADKAR